MGDFMLSMRRRGSFCELEREDPGRNAAGGGERPLRGPAGTVGVGAASKLSQTRLAWGLRAVDA